VDDRFADTALIERAIDGDRGALDALWRSVRRWVGAVVLAHKPREADLEDLVQQVALTMCARIGEVRDPSGFKPWLRRVAINTARADGRKTTRRRAGFLRFVGGVPRGSGRSGGRGAEDDGLSERARLVLGAAREIPEKYREPVILRCVHAMSHKQIGEVMGLPATTVETRIARGRRMLRGAIERLENEQQQRQEAGSRETAAAPGGAR